MRASHDFQRRKGGMQVLRTLALLMPQDHRASAEADCVDQKKATEAAGSL